jgi:TM2 domain-containing membrane protein YozV
MPPKKGADMADGKSDKSNTVALLLCFFIGILGVHRFYVGKIGTGILHLVTLGAFGIWTLVDLIMIILQKFTDSDGNTLRFN